jgi:hypothetical protein
VQGGPENTDVTFLRNSGLHGGMFEDTADFSPSNPSYQFTVMMLYLDF